MGAGHHHHGLGGRGQGRLGIALALAATYMVAEFVGGLVSGSLALLADAAHMLSDVAALSLSLFAAWMARRPSGARHTYGYYRTEILAALVNGALLLAVSVFIFKEAWERFFEPSPVRGGLMLVVAAGGLVVNGVGIVLLREARHASLNVRAAWLHLIADALGSVAAIAAALCIQIFGWTWADAVASALIALLVIRASWELLGETVGVLMEGAPGHLDVDEVRDAILGVDGVLEVHDLHVWCITSDLVSLSCHAVWESEAEHAEVLGSVHRMLRERFGIEHVTVQGEPEGFEESQACS